MNEFEKAVQDILKNIKGIAAVVIILVLVVLGKSTFYTVEPDEEAVVIRFGKFIGTYPPGLHFKMPVGIDEVFFVKTKRVLQEEFGFRTKSTANRRTEYSRKSFDHESLMLTGDLNVAEVEWVVQYQISDPFKYIFQTSNPTINVRDVSESIMRRVVGDRSVTEVLTTGRVEIAIEAQKLMQGVLDRYDMGIKIVTVKLQDVNPPNEVKPSFNEVNEAKQEQEKVINQAEQAYNKVIPEAKGKAEKMISEAEGYAAGLVNESEGDAAKFTAILKEYKRAPLITRKRIYIETMEKIFRKMENLTIVDSKIKGLLPIFGKDEVASKVVK
ncbi:MAG: membrane protease subunit HflK [Bacteriovoracaceae bacterium]|jgi:membrane protease subunit HflK